MSFDNDQLFIDDLLKLSKESGTDLVLLVPHFVKIFQELQRENENLVKQKAHFIQQLDQRKTLQVQDSQKQEKILEHKSRMAAMGEMIDAVAHQWKQPLNGISMINDMLRSDFAAGEVDQAYIDDITQNIDMLVEHMSDTLSEFRTFFRPSKKSEHFRVLDCVQSVQVLMKDQLISNNVRLITDIDKHIYLFGMSNEFKHLFINLLNNSIDAFEGNKIQQREILIRVSQENGVVYIEVEDNGGGIPKGVISDIFQPNVTTKAEGKGTGIGLYMSRQIVQKHSGVINVRNNDKGAIFTIILKQHTV